MYNYNRTNPSSLRARRTHPHKRQRCLRRRHPKLRPHLIQELVLPIPYPNSWHPMIHFVSSAEWARFPFSFFLHFPLGLNKTRITYKLLQLARKVPSRSSDGKKERACKDQRMCWRSQGRVGIGHVEKQIIESWLLWSQKSKHPFLLLWLKWLSVSIFFLKTYDRYFSPAYTTKLN